MLIGISYASVHARQNVTYCLEASSTQEEARHIEEEAHVICWEEMHVDEMKRAMRDGYHADVEARARC